ncbi:MAG: zinc-binding dehydrogenase [Sphaerochaeta sp.]|nr:zinc-binding dehydrogenase [Sphaerochaeta sp.]
MKGLVKFAAGPGNLEIREVPEPQVESGQVKIEIKAAGICGSDIHIYHSDIAIPVRPPVIIGHEFAGVVVAVGEGVTTCKVGDRVSSETAYSYCGKCHNCKTGRYNLCNDRKTLGYWYNGAFAKYTVVPGDRIQKLPDSISFEEGALLEPAACVTHAVMDLATIQAGDMVLVSGPGAVGLIAMQVAKAHGAYVIVSGTNVDTDRLTFALKLGADRIVDVTKEDLLEVIKSLTPDGRGVDVVLECSGSGRATATGIEAVRKQGQFIQIGLAGKPFELNFDRICYKEIKVTGSLGSVWTAWRNAIRLVETKQLNLRDLISHEFKLQDWEKGFEVFENKEGLKVLFRPE